MRLTSAFLLLALSIAAPAAAQQRDGAAGMSGVSVQRIKDGLAKKRGSRLNVNVQQPVATFRTTIEREYLPSFKEQLRKQFELSDFQRQSQEWASKGRGLNLAQLAAGIRSAYRDYKAQQIREEVTRERLAVEAASRQ